jgi:hypothetical protein
MSSEANIYFLDKHRKRPNKLKNNYQCISQYFVVFCKFTQLTMHGDDFKHLFKGYTSYSVI